MSDKLTGACLCGGVRYSATGPFGNVACCHCGQCSQWSGGVFSSVNARRDKLSIAGEENIKWYASSAEARRGFCGICGSSLFWEKPGSGRIAILMGSVSAPTGMEISEHIYVDDKSDYYRICDGKPQFGQDRSTPAVGDDAE